MGYSTEQFLSAINLSKGFICAICLGVLQNTKLINPCEHLFCERCINLWMQKSVTCPVDRRVIKAVGSPPKCFIEVLNSLEKFCEFESAGCRSVIKLGDVKSHNKRCDFNPANVKGCVDGCGAVLKPSEIFGHNCASYLKEIFEKKHEKYAKVIRKFRKECETVQTYRKETEKFKNIMFYCLCFSLIIFVVGISTNIFLAQI